MKASSSGNVVLTCYYRDKPGGLCKRLSRALRALQEHGDEVHYVSTTPFPDAGDGCRYHPIWWPSGNRESWLFWAYFFAVTPIYLLFICHRHAVTHLFVFEPTYSFLMIPARWARNVPISVFLRADSIANQLIKNRNKLLVSVAIRAERIALRGATVIAVSNQCLYAVLARHPGLRLRGTDLLRNDAPPFPPMPRPAPAAAPLRVSVIGVLEPRKNQSLVVRALQDVSGVELHLYGVGGAGPALKSLATDLGVSAKVHFHDWTPVDRILGSTHLVLMPSLHEGAPNAVLEALAARVPVLASDIPEHREILPETLLLPLAPLAWAKRLQQIVDDPALELTRLTEQADAARQLSSFNWDKALRSKVIEQPGTTGNAGLEFQSSQDGRS